MADAVIKIDTSLDTGGMEIDMKGFLDLLSKAANTAKESLSVIETSASKSMEVFGSAFDTGSMENFQSAVSKAVEVAVGAFGLIAGASGGTKIVIDTFDKLKNDFSKFSEALTNIIQRFGGFTGPLAAEETPTVKVAMSEDESIIVERILYTALKRIDYQMFTKTAGISSASNSKSYWRRSRGSS